MYIISAHHHHHHHHHHSGGTIIELEGSLTLIVISTITYKSTAGSLFIILPRFFHITFIMEHVVFISPKLWESSQTTRSWRVKSSILPSRHWHTVYKYNSKLIFEKCYLQIWKWFSCLDGYLEFFYIKKLFLFGNLLLYSRRMICWYPFCLNT